MGIFNVFDLVATLRLDKSDYDDGLNDASKQAQETSKKMSTAAKVAVGAAVAGTVAVAKKSIDAGMEFDKAMSQVAATMGKTMDDADVNTLRDFAQKMGSETVFSATQAAEALNYMALAGYDAQTSMSMLPNVLNLAAAGNIDLAYASDMITDSQTALGLSLEQTNTLVDEMAKVSSTTNTSVSQLGEAILTIGGTAQFMSGGTEELTQVLGILADNGIKGSEAGTKLRNMLLKLSAPTDAGVIAMENLGLSVFDAEGNMRSFVDIFSDLQNAMSGLTGEEQVTYLSDLFNARDVAAAQALMTTTADRWEEVASAIDVAQGSAQQMADTQLDNLAGDVTLFNSALEGTKIALSDELKDVLRDIVKLGSDMLSSFTKFIKSGGIKKITDGFKKLAPVIAGVTSAWLAFKAAMGITSLINTVKGAITALNLAMAANPAGAIALAIIGVGTALVTLWNTSDDFRGAIKLILEDIGGFFSDCFDGIVAIFEDLPAFFSWVWDGIKDVFSTIGEWFGGIFTGAWEGIQTAWAGVTKWFGDVWNGIKDVFSGAWGSVTSWFSNLFLDAAGAIAIAWSDVVGFFGRIWDKIKEKFADVADWFGRTFKKAADKIAENFNPFAIVDVIKEGAAGFQDFTMGVLADITGSNNATPTATATPAPVQETTVVAPIYINGEKYEEATIKAEQSRNYRSGGRS